MRVWVTGILCILLILRELKSAGEGVCMALTWPFIQQHSCKRYPHLLSMDTKGIENDRHFCIGRLMLVSQQRGFEWMTDQWNVSYFCACVHEDTDHYITHSSLYKKPDMVNFYSKFKWGKLRTYKGMACFLPFWKWGWCHWTYLSFALVVWKLRVQSAAQLYQWWRLFWHSYLILIPLVLST